MDVVRRDQLPPRLKHHSLVDGLQASAGGKDRFAMGERIKAELSVVRPAPTVTHTSKRQGFNWEGGKYRDEQHTKKSELIAFSLMRQNSCHLN